MLSSRQKAPAIVLAALAVTGIGFWIYQLMNGLGVTGMSNATSWGLYITCFMFFVGLSAGGLIVASSASIFHIEKFKKVALPAVILSTCCICAAGCFVLVDLGGIQRVWRLITGPNVTSPLLWDVCVITIYLIINILYLVFMCGKKADPNKVAVISRFALPVAILVHSVTAWIFGLQIAKEGWYTAIMAPIFVASAMDSGLALLLISLIAMTKAKIIDVGKDLIASLAGLLATCIAIDAYFVGCEILTTAYPQGDAATNILGQMLTGATAPAFWTEIIIGVLVPFCILVFAKNRQRTGLVIGASVCVVVGVFCKRIWLLFTSFIVPNVEGAPGITMGNQAAQADPASLWSLMGVYAPTIPEVLIVCGVVSLWALIYLVLVNKLIIGKQSKKASSSSAVAEAA